MNLPHSHLCPWAQYSLLQSPEQGHSQDNHPCTRGLPPASHPGLSPSPAQVALAGPWHHQCCWHAGPFSHGSPLPQGSAMPCHTPGLPVLTPSVPWLLSSCPTPLGRGTGAEQCLLHSHLLLYQCPCPFLLIQLCLLITSSPNSPSFRLSRQ